MRSRLTLFFLPFYLGLDIACGALDIAQKHDGRRTAAAGRLQPHEAWLLSWLRT
ncbi:hypothetical protein [Streptomyces avermitilis]|uniref:hypothetical protein n=1 Tax=Streptomyces avermitilis TaxID=33903 RepID=UPI003682AE8B